MRICKNSRRRVRSFMNGKCRIITTVNALIEVSCCCSRINNRIDPVRRDGYPSQSHCVPIVPHCLPAVLISKDDSYKQESVVVKSLFEGHAFSHFLLPISFLSIARAMRIRVSGIYLCYHISKLSAGLPFNPTNDDSLRAAVFLRASRRARCHETENFHK